MKLLAGFIASSLPWLVILPSSYACSIAPDYLPNEIGHSGVVMGNIVEDAETIIYGELTQTSAQTSFSMKVKKSVKPSRNIFFDRERKINFNKVSQYYLLKGTDKAAFKNPKEIYDYLSLFLESKSNTKEDTQRKGYGGLISSISHGSDCERIVVAFDDQKYLTFLNENDAVMAILPVVSTRTMNPKNLIHNLDKYLDN